MPKWLGPIPNHCDICGRDIVPLKCFIDGATKLSAGFGGRWGIMCQLCFIRHGVGLGQGSGQRYAMQPDGSYQKVAG